MNNSLSVIPAEIAARSGEFIGRESIIQQITRWLDGPEPVFLLTGLPGTGKSQLALHLAEMYASQDSSRRSAHIVLLHAHFCRARDDRTLDPLRFARDLAQCLETRFPDWRHVLNDDREEQVRQEVTGAATVITAEPGATVAGVLSEIHLGDVSARPALQRLVVRPLERLYQQDALPGRLLIIVDGLDEALTYPASDTIVDVLASLAGTLPEPVRIVLTTRPDPLVLRRLRTLQPHDLETDEADVVAYALQRLAAVPEPGRKAWAEAIAKAGRGNFLYARHVLDDLLAHPGRLAGNPESTPLPAGLDAYYAEYLDRELSRTNQAWSDRYRPLLSLLVVARGAGLTWSMLADITGIPPSHLDDALNRLRQYLIGPWPDGPLRLYHESFREYLITAPDHQVYPQEAEQQLAQSLAAAPQSDYARAHRAAHAAAARRLDELLCDASAILTVEPRSLLVVLDAADSLEGRWAGEAFRRAYPRLREGVAPLHLAALQVGAQQLASSIARMPSTRRGAWRPSWAWWRRPAPAQTVAILDPAEWRYPLVAALDTENGPVAVVVTRGKIESWDLERGQQLAQAVISAHVRCIVDCGSRDQAAVAMGDDRGTIALLAVPSLVNHLERTNAHPAAITCAVPLASSALLATGDEEGTISLWTLPDLSQVACQPDAHTLIFSLAAVEVGGEELLISGGDRWEVAPGRAKNMPSLRTWTVPGLKLRASESRDNQITQWLGAIQAGESAFVQARGVTSQEVWRLDPGTEAFRLVEQVNGNGSPTALIEIADGEGILCTGDELVPLRVQPAEPVTLDRGRPVECEPASWAGPVPAHGRERMLVSASGKLRLWAIRDIYDESAAAPDESVHSRRCKSSITQIAVGEGLLCAGTEGGSVHTWVTASTPHHEEHPLSGQVITGLAVTAIAGQTYFVVGLASGELSLIDAANNESLWKVAAGNHIFAVKTVRLAGRQAVLAAVDMSPPTQRRLYVCRLWDLSSGEEIESFDPEQDWDPGDGWRLAAEGYQRDKPLRAVAVWQTPNGPMAAACCSASPVPVWLLEEQRQVTQLSVDNYGAYDLDFGHGHLVAGAGGNLHIWDASRQWSGFSVPARHSVASVACGTYAGRPCIASGGYDGSLQIWGLDGSHLATIDIDEAITALAALEGGRFAVGTSRGLLMIETD
jgi:WD40 repeat protein